MHNVYNVYAQRLNDFLSWAFGTDTSTVAIADNVSLHHALGRQVLARLLRASQFVVVASVKVSTDSTLSSTVSGSQSDSSVVLSVADVNAQGLGEDEDVVFIVLVDLEDLGVSFVVDDLVGKSNRLSINGDRAQVVDVNLVFTEVGGDSKLVVGSLVSENKVSWSL